jgi:hypothetical protein
VENGPCPRTQLKKRSAKKISEILERGSRILDLRKEGKSLRAISAILVAEAEDKKLPTRGFSYEQVRKDFWEMVNLRINEQGESVDHIRALCAERLDEVFERCFPLLRDETVDTRIKAANAIVRASKEYAELYGAKRPQQIEHGGAVATYVMSKEEWEAEASNRLMQTGDQLRKFDDETGDKSNDPDAAGNASGAVPESPIGDGN